MMRQRGELALEGLFEDIEERSLASAGFTVGYGRWSVEDMGIVILMRP